MERCISKQYVAPYCAAQETMDVHLQRYFYEQMFLKCYAAEQYLFLDGLLFNVELQEIILAQCYSMSLSIIHLSL